MANFTAESIRALKDTLATTIGENAEKNEGVTLLTTERDRIAAIVADLQRQLAENEAALGEVQTDLDEQITLAKPGNDAIEAAEKALKDAKDEIIAEKNKATTNADALASEIARYTTASREADTLLAEF
jgi:chromosome segregation ATPase